ncbi:nucleotidyltransferase domain-containing protein [uncultured Gimesia sp.]|uniref:nucleotidyltransferase domain-containing protein n=1 Tax=uncultured Gimesia sp. TaxID=1678688 RepID=UPI0034544168
MSVHQRIIPGLLEVCASIHPDCAVVLIGSVAQGTERPCSDLDLNLIFPGDELPQNQHPYVGDDNRWQLVVKDKIEGIRIDIAWETQQVLGRNGSSFELRGFARR